jgi:magnesium transporter
MLTVYEARVGAAAGEEGQRGTLQQQKGKPRITEQTVWIDLLKPTDEEETKIERALKFDVPTREEQQEIEVSSRLYQEDGAYFMTASILYQGEEGPTSAVVTFILAGKRLVTVRYADPRAFSLFTTRACRSETGLVSGTAVLMGLIEVIVDRLADFVERIQAEVDALSHSIFENNVGGGSRQRGFDELLRALGKEGEISSRARESLHSLGRLLTFLTHAANERKEDKLLKARIRTAARDVLSLTDHVSFLANKIVFLLDATLGMVNIEQNNIIKIFSVAAVVFLPPTLVASIYGMNFHFMPELGWEIGYPFAILLMILSAVLPYLYFKRRGWL